MDRHPPSQFNHDQLPQIRYFPQPQPFLSHHNHRLPPPRPQPQPNSAPLGNPQSYFHSMPPFPHQRSPHPAQLPSRPLPPPTSSYQTLPVRQQRPYNPPQPLFANIPPNYSKPSGNSYSHPHWLQVPHHQTHRFVTESTRSCQEYRPAPSDSQRVLPDDRIPRYYPPQYFNLETIQRPLEQKTISPQQVDTFIHDLEGRARLRVDNNNGFRSHSREEFVRDRLEDDKFPHRVNFLSSRDRDHTLQRNFESDSRSYDRRRSVEYDNEINKVDIREENNRWVHDRIASRDVHDTIFELEHSEIGYGDGTNDLMVPREQIYHESVYMDRACGESSHDFNRTHEKQVQKKSALLRLQKPKSIRKSRESESFKMHYSGQLEISDSQTKVEKRERSPVELDVSFKSNSLVAKAIVSSSNSVISGAPATKKMRKIFAYGDDSPKPQTKGSAENLDNSLHAVTRASPSGNNTPTDKHVNGSAKASPFKVGRKKKFVKTIVRKVEISNLNGLRSQPSEKPSLTDGSKLSPSAVSSCKKLHKPSEEGNITGNEVLCYHSADPTPEKPSVSDYSLSENDAGTISSPALRSKNMGCGSNKGEENGNHEIATDITDPVNSALKFKGFLDTEKVLGESLPDRFIDNIGKLEGASKQSSPKEVSLSLDDKGKNEKMSVINCVVDNSNLGPFSSVDVKCNKELLDSWANEIEGTQEIASTMQTTEDIGFSSSRKTRFQDDRTYTECIYNDQVTNTDFDHCCSSSLCSIPLHSSSIEVGIGEQLSPCVGTQYLGHCDEERSSNGVPSIKYDAGDVDTVKRSTTRTQLKFSSSNTEHEPVNTVDIDNRTIDTNTTLTSFEKDHKANSDSYHENLVASFGIIKDAVSFTRGKGLLHGSLEEKLAFIINADNVTKDIPPLYHKKRKFSNTPDDTPTESDLHCKIAFISPHAENCISPVNYPTQQMAEVVVPSQDTIHPTLLRQCLDGSDFFPNNRLSEGFDTEGLKLDDHDVNPSSMLEESVFPKVQSASLTVFKKEGTEISSNFSLSNSQENAIVESGLQDKAETYIHLTDKFPFHSETADCKVLLEHGPHDGELKSASSDTLSSFLTTDVHCSSQLNNQSLPTYSGQDALPSSSNSIGELVESVPDALPSSLDTALLVPWWNISNCNASLSIVPNEKGNRCDNNLIIKLISEDGLKSVASRSSDQCSEMNTKVDHATKSDNSFIQKIASPLSRNFTKNTVQHSHLVKSNLKSDKPSNVIPVSSSFLLSVSKKSRHAKHIVKPRTWHRSVNSAAGFIPSGRQCGDNNGNSQNISYIRKGNSLVLKPVSLSKQSHSLSVDQKNPLGINDHQKTIKHKTGAGTTGNCPIPFCKSEAATEPCGAPSFYHSGNTSACLEDGTCCTRGTMTSVNSTCSPSDVSLSNGCCGSLTDPSKNRETDDVPTYSLEEMKGPEALENQTGPFHNEESQSEVNDHDLPALALRRIIYVKRNANQLVAATRPCGPSVSNGGDVQSTQTDCYYKMRKNQLIRSSQESQLNQKIMMPEKVLNSVKHRSSKMISSKNRSLKAAATRVCRPLRASLVWTLRGTHPSEKFIDSFHQWKVLPNPFPWKRAIYWRSHTNKTHCSSKSSSFSTISNKLLSLRNMDTIYTRSKNGFSLRKSKVLGIAGSSLKWSKSIKKRSKKENEEATRVVAAVDKKKREQKDAAPFSFGTERERIFRVGLSRYKMDPSRRTLQRISDDSQACYSSLSSDKDANRSYTPRRLVIGNDEYVQIGNGNQLVRDPKKRTRMLASEKVRRSLHTARMRLAKKRQYCQFFTRFGKCNKDDGKCPYIHDSSKIAVCTKFLSGLCCNPSCKLTHKVIPERMPDCSYYLQGLCTNGNCPYRHVKVNPKASTCEAFLRGYCAEGNECRKKHSYVCPAFQETGTCRQPESCKLYHPKSPDKGKKRKRSDGQKNSRGRYFGTMGINASEPGFKLAPKQYEQNTANSSFEEKLGDFISLGDDSDIEVGESFQTSKQPTSCEIIGSGFDGLDDLDKMIKPVLIMKENSVD